MTCTKSSVKVCNVILLSGKDMQHSMETNFQSLQGRLSAVEKRMDSLEDRINSAPPSALVSESADNPESLTRSRKNPPELQVYNDSFIYYTVNIKFSMITTVVILPASSANDSFFI